MASYPHRGTSNPGSKLDHAETGKAREKQQQNTEPNERLGPIELTRHVKRDGRRLILYTHEEHPGT